MTVFSIPYHYKIMLDHLNFSLNSFTLQLPMSSNSLYYPIQIKEVLVQVTFEATNAHLCHQPTHVYKYL